MRTIVVLTALMVLCFAATAYAQVGCTPCAVQAPQPVYVSASSVASNPCYPPTVTYYYPPAANYYPTVAYPYVVARPVYAYRPILPVASMPRSYFVGPGIIGQPTVYVPGQPVRNLLRYVSP